MIDDEARAWVRDGFGDAAVAQIDTFVDLLTAEAERQNLIAPSTLPTIWTRHVLDSAQLVPLASATGTWIDIGTGAGFPGLVVAMLRRQPTVLIEPRKQRAAFLEQCALALGLPHVVVRASKVEAIATPAAVMSARAVAPVEKLLHAGAGCATSATRWLLPRGRSGAAEMVALRQRWAGVFHMKQSLTDPESTILILDGPRRR